MKTKHCRYCNKDVVVADFSPHPNTIDGMEHGAWGWADKMLEEGWQDLKDSFKTT